MASDSDRSDAIGAALSREQGRGRFPYDESHSSKREVYEATRQSAMTNLQQWIDLQRQARECDKGPTAHSQQTAITVISGEQNKLQARIDLAFAGYRGDLRSMDSLLTEIASEERRSLPKASAAIIMSMSMLGQLFSHNMMNSVKNDHIMLSSRLEDFRSMSYHALSAEGMSNAGPVYDKFQHQTSDFVKRLHALDIKYRSWGLLRITFVAGLVASAMFFAYRYGRYALARWSRSRVRDVQKELDQVQTNQTSVRFLEGLPFHMMWIVNTFLPN